MHQEFKADVRLCASCGRFLSNKDFDASPAGHTLSRCRRCAHTHVESVTRTDPVPYADLLSRVQRVEAVATPPSRICFALTAADMRVLVEQVWGGRSVLSQQSEVHRLTLARWDLDEPWTPWNSVLLTEEEAAAHVSMGAHGGVYAAPLVQRIQHRCMQARMLFKRLAEQDPVFAQ